MLLLAQIAEQTVTATQSVQPATVTTSVTVGGVGLGSVLAVVCSWDRNRSILWGILAGILSWIYVVFFALTRTAK
jgi:hypothetical protein